MPDAKAGIPTKECGLEELTRKVARVEGQTAGKEEESETSDENGPVHVAKPAQVVSGRRHLRLLVHHLMCRVGRSEEPIMEQRAARTLAARQDHQTALGKFLEIITGAHASSGRLRRKRRCPGRAFQRLLRSGSSTSQWITASCNSDGSLAVVQPLLMWQCSSSFCGYRTCVRRSF